HGQWLSPGEVIEAYPGGLAEFLCPPRGLAGIPTPWSALTDLTSGLQRGELFLIAGRTSMGKTIVAMQMAVEAARRSAGVAVFSLEMSKEALVRRLIATLGSVDHGKLRSGKLDRDERLAALNAANEIKNLPLWIDDTRARTMPAMTAALRKR